jgi:hypothetical protein
MKNLFNFKYWIIGQKYKIIIISILMPMLMSCNKNEDNELVDQLPKATQTGDDVFACLINEEVWVANEGLSGTKIVSMKYDESGEYIHGNNFFRISCLRSSNWGVQLEKFKIKLEPVTNLGELNLESLKTLEVEYSEDDNIVDPEIIEKNYTLKDDSPMVFSFSLIDTINNICSGTFEFQLQNVNDSLDVISVTNGRFDAPYTVY